MGISIAKRARRWPSYASAHADISAIADSVCELARDWKDLNAQQLAHKASELKSRMGRTIRNADFSGREIRSVQFGSRRRHYQLLVESCALAHNACRRVTGMEPYEVQVQAGVALARGSIAEMGTGEGKTLTTLFPALYHALQARSVHVATVNSYLAARDYGVLAPVLESLGCKVGLASEKCNPQEKRQAYQCDVTFATGYELGFDYLRDCIGERQNRRQPRGDRLRRQLKGYPANAMQPIQQQHAVAIIDEIDSVLIDEATMPLILSSASHNEVPADLQATYVAAQACAQSLVPEVDFIIDEGRQLVDLTFAGADKADRDLAAHQPREMTQHKSSNHPRIHNAIPQPRLLSLLDASHAHSHPGCETAQEESDPQVAMRLQRPWHAYVQSALRAEHLLNRNQHYVIAEGRVQIVDEFTGRIHKDRNWRDGLHQAVEMKEGVEVTPESLSLARISRQSYFGQYDQLCGMTGTASACRREFGDIYDLNAVAIPPRRASLRRELPCRFFRSVEDQVAAIVADATARHAQNQPVLIGTRTIHRSRLVAQQLAQRGLEPQLLNGVQDEEEAKIVARAGVAGTLTVATNLAGRGTDIRLCSQAAAAGGLHIIGCERNFSSRIDRQLLGRAGRQGQPGSGQFFVSPDDELLKRYRSDFAQSLSRSRTPEVQGGRTLDREVQRAQAHAESAALAARREAMRQALWVDGLRSGLQ